MEQTKIDFKNVGIGYIVNKTALYFKITVLQLFKEKNFSITPEQFSILFFLSREDGMYQRQLAKISLKDRPNITRLIDILEERGFVYRETDPNNRRIFKVFITEEGKKQIEEIHPYLREMQKKAINGINTEETDLLRKLLGKICENMDENFKLQI
jgi:DNA-binding MarR family transcriptional regulator